MPAPEGPNMTQYRYHTRAAVSLVTALALVLPPGALVFSAQAPGAATPAKATEPAAAPKASATPAPVDGGWPRAYTTPSGAHLVLYQPQVASWDAQERMVAYSAVSSAQGRRQARDRHRQGRGRHQSRARRSAGQLREVHRHREQLRHRPTANRCGTIVSESRRRFRARSASSRSTVCWPASTRA